MADTIKEFLVGLGYKVDSSSERLFLDGIRRATQVVSALGVTVDVSMTLIADNLEKMYFAARRVRDSVGDLQAFGFAAGQLGSSVEAAQGSLENFARFLRSSPGAIAVVRNLGVTAQTTTGMLEQLGPILERLPTGLRAVYANLFGLDERTMFALMDNFGKFAEQYRSMQAAAGFNADEGARSSHEFMNEVRLLSAALTILAQKVSVGLLGSGNLLGEFRRRLVDNFGPISVAITRAIRLLLTLGEQAGRLLLRGVEAIQVFYGWWTRLDDRTKGLIETVAALSVGWKLLTGALAGALGPVGLLIVGLLALWDDYQTWKEGGKSLVDWGRWEPEIQKALKKFDEINDWFTKLTHGVGLFQGALAGLLLYMGATWVTGMVTAIARVGGALLSAFTLGAVGGGGASAAAGAAGAASRVPGLLRWLGPVGAFLWGMWPTPLEEHNPHAVGYGVPPPPVPEQPGFEGGDRPPEREGSGSAGAGTPFDSPTSLQGGLGRAGLPKGANSSSTLHLGVTPLEEHNPRATFGSPTELQGGLGRAGAPRVRVAATAADVKVGIEVTSQRPLPAPATVAEVGAVVAKFLVAARVFGLPMSAFFWGMWPGEANAGEDDLLRSLGAAGGGAQPVDAGTSGGSPTSVQHRTTLSNLSALTTRAVQFFTQHGWSLAQASGIVANLQAESGLDVSDVGDDGSARGLAQWHPDRQGAIEAHFGKRLAEMSYEEQLAAVDWELRQGNEQRAGYVLRGSLTPENSGRVGSAFYERPANATAEADKRAQLARSIYDRYLNTGLTAPPVWGADVDAPRGSGDVNVTPNTTINVYGGGNPRDTAAAVSDAQRGVNADLVRNLLPAYR